MDEGTAVVAARRGRDRVDHQFICEVVTSGVRWHYLPASDQVYLHLVVTGQTAWNAHLDVSVIED